MDIAREIKGWLGMKLNGVSFNIDIVNGCVLSCPSCAVGVFGRRRHKLMSLDYFKRILDKAQRECKVRKVQLYSYSDSCQHPDLHLFVKECGDRGIPTIISTTLQGHGCDYAKVIEARPTEFRISFPGWDHMNYYQYPAQPKRFDKNFREVMKLPRYPETWWTMCFHVYKDNQDEIERARVMARAWNLKFIPLPAIFMSQEKNVERQYSAADKELHDRLPLTAEQCDSLYKHSDYCMCWKQVTIDANGDVYLCQNVYEERFWQGSFFDKSVWDHIWTSKHSEFCRKCIATGGNRIQESYIDFTTNKDPVAEANKTRLK